MDGKVHIPRVLVAAPSSGSGKTLVMCGILRLLKRMGKHVQSFKCGPDYIDPLFHRHVLGIPAVNLDTYFTDEEMTRALFVEHARGASMALIEGVMGLFDGVAGTSLQASSMDVARVTETPVILVVDMRGMSRSVVALVQGFCGYSGGRSLIRGIILNNISAARYRGLASLIEAEARVPVLGYVPADTRFAWESRHLGLYLPDEVAGLHGRLDALADCLQETLDVPALCAIADAADDMVSPCGCGADKPHDTRPVRIGIARDEAFCFYYEDNFRLLRKLGAELVPFSPVHDSALPAVDGVLLGGGYPELYARQLQENASLRHDVCLAVKNGIPLLAECGGFLFLQTRMTVQNGHVYEMCGALPGESWYTGHLVRFGYAEFLPKKHSAAVRGHEFHYFDSTENGCDFTAVKPNGSHRWDCMVCRDGITAGFPHLYYYSCPEFARSFVELCRA